MVAASLDLIGDNAVEIGSSYEITISLCCPYDLTQFLGLCHVKANSGDNAPLLAPGIEVLTKDAFKLKIPFGAYSASVTAGTYQYDVLFIKSDPNQSASVRFYAVAGKIQFLKRITTVI